jgi:hypothetical protein
VRQVNGVGEAVGGTGLGVKVTGFVGGGKITGVEEILFVGEQAENPARRRIQVARRIA